MFPELNKIYAGDCLEIMKQWPDKCVDLVLTDPPYGEKITKKANTYGGNSKKWDHPRSRKATNESWDDKPASIEQIKEIIRISKNQIIFGANYFLEALHSSRCYIVWDKRGSLPEVPFADTEWAWTSFNKMSKKYTVINHGFITDIEEKREHPTQKPLTLFGQILRDFAQEGQIVCDPFLGSGTTAVAAQAQGLSWIGIEQEPKYIAIAQKRIEAERAQGKLF